MSTEKRKSNSVTNVSQDLMAGILTISVLDGNKTVGTIEFDARELGGKFAFASTLAAHFQTIRDALAADEIDVNGIEITLLEIEEGLSGYVYDELTEIGKTGYLHGYEQKLRDRAAIEKDTKTGKSATPAEKFDAVQKLAEHLRSGGAWNMKGGGIAPLNRAALYQAVATVRNRKPEDVEAMYRSREDVVLRTLLAIDEIAAEYARLTARGNSAKANELLAELDAQDENVGGESSEGGTQEALAS